MIFFASTSLVLGIFSLVFLSTSVTAQTEWEPIGPASVEMITFAANSDYLFGSLLEIGGSLYRSSDGGATWDEIFAPLFSTHYLSVVHADDEVVLVVETSQGHGRYMYRSTDNGRSWEDVLMEEEGISTQRYSCVKIGSTIYAHYANHLSTPFVAYSNDRGRYWSHLKGEDLDLRKVLGLHAVADTLVLVAEDDVGGGLFLTADTGRTWTIRRTPDNEGSWYSIEVDGRSILAKRNSQIIFSEDLGQTWQNSTLYADTLWIAYYPVGAKGTVIIPGVTSALYSRDTGRTWHRSDSSYPYTFPRYNGNKGCLRSGIWTGDGFVFGHSERIGNFYTEGGETWTSFGRNLPQNGHVVGMALFEDKLLVLRDQLTSDNLFSSTDAGSTWQVNNEQVPSSEQGHLFSTSRGFFQSREDALYFSQDGRLWEKLEGTPGRIQGFADADATVLSWTESGQLWHSTDHGTTWSPITSFTLRAHTALIFEGIFLAAGTDLLRSSDSGRTWDTVRLDNGQNIYLNGITRSGSNLYAVSSNLENALLHSADSGKTWQPIMDRIPFNWESNLVHTTTTLFSFDSVVVLNVHHEYVRNSFISTDHGSTWERLGRAPDTLLLGPINRMVRVGDYLIAPMDGKTAWNAGLYRIPVSHLLSSVRTIAAERVQPEGEISWNQSDRTFNWRVEQSGEAETTLFDLFGRKIFGLYRGSVRQGVQNQVAMPEEDLITGTYFVVLTVEGEIVVQTLLQIAD